MSLDRSGWRELTRRQFAGGLAGLLTCSVSRLSFAAARPVSFGVFSLFEPREVTLQAEEPLLLTLSGNFHDRWLLAARGSPVSIRWIGEKRMTVTLGSGEFTVGTVLAASPSARAANFTLTVPASQRHGSIRRTFHGSLAISSVNRCVQPVIAMEIETAVGSIVDAESPADAPLEFLMAQAVASRSFLLAARAAHPGFDFCDTTHCQYLRGSATPGSPAQLAVTRTAGRFLQFAGRPLAAMYSRSCSGRTHSLAGLGSALDYPYYTVSCDYCLHHPDKWEREVPRDALPHTERQRLAFDRVHGWSALPSCSFAAVDDHVTGRGIGHGIGMCQRGGAAMARSGAGFEGILAHYYPNTLISTESY